MTIGSRPQQLQTFGTVPERYDVNWYSAFLAQLTRRLGLLSGPFTVQPQLLLQSPDGTIWKITVNNSGVVSGVVATRGDVQPPV